MDVKREQPETSSESPTPSHAAPAMPNFTRPRHGFYHTVDSALASLSQLGITPDRVTVRKKGLGWKRGRVVEQELVPEGDALTPESTVELKVEGEGLFDYLPTGMREASREGEFGTEQLASLFDDAVEKAAFYVRQGGLYFDLRPENKVGYERWIRLFGIDHEEWPEGVRYRLALLLPALHRGAGREEGLRLALKVLLGLDVVSLGRCRRLTRLAEDERSLFGGRASRLGTELVIGEGLEDEATVDITLGPVSLEAYSEHTSAGGQRLIAQALRLALPYHLNYALGWVVGDTSRAPRLGEETENSVLGVNTHLGRH
jgi:hypothetical protein